MAMTLVQAIARMEGFGHAGNIPTRNNNPGDICAGAFTAAHGADGADGRFAHFPSADTGLTALRALLTEHYIGLSVAAALAKYAPGCENDTAAYVRNVCAWMACTPETIVTAELIG